MPPHQSDNCCDYDGMVLGCCAGAARRPLPFLFRAVASLKGALALGPACWLATAEELAGYDLVTAAERALPAMDNADALDAATRADAAAC